MTPIEYAHQAKEAFRKISPLKGDQKNEVLNAFASSLKENQELIFAANDKDIQEAKGKINPKLVARLKFDKIKMRDTLLGIEGLIALPDPIGTVLASTELDEGLILDKISCPIGLIGIIFESRPDVVPQLLSLAIKSSNTLLLKGGKEALNTNRALMNVAYKAFEQCSYPLETAILLEAREDIHALLGLHDDIDLIIPRGSNELVQFIQNNTKIPVLGHADGICHIYIEHSIPLQEACAICIDAKTSYPAACNSVETILIEEQCSDDFKRDLIIALKKADVQLNGDEKFCALDKDITPTKDWSKEYSDTIVALKSVANIDEAIIHINRFGSGHTDAILSYNDAHVQRFFNEIDSAGVFHNASTRFADGFRYGFGAEVGISTSKTHARGPVGLDGLTIYKYILRGHGHCSSDYTGSHTKKFRHKKLL